MDTTAISENKGWVKIYRKLLDNPISKKPNYLSIFIYLLLKVNHKDNDIILEGKKTIIKRGQFLTSIFSIPEFFNLSTSTVSRILKYLETERIIEKLSTNKYSLITVLNYNLYQDPESIFENKSKTDQKQKELLRNEIMEISNFATSGEVIERNFFIMLWSRYREGIESDLIKECKEMIQKFESVNISSDIIKEQEIVRLCNLINNPADTHIENMDI